MTILDIILPCTLIIVGYFVLRAIGRYSDKRQWNGGICPYTGKPWELVCDDFSDCVCYASGIYSIWLSRKTPLVNRRTYVLEQD